MKLTEIMETDHQKVDAICKQMGIELYSILADGSVMVQGNMEFNNQIPGQRILYRYTAELPIQFDSVRDSLDSYTAFLSSYKGFPKNVGSSATIYHANKYKSYEGFPETIGRSLLFYTADPFSLRGLHEHLKSISGYIRIPCEFISEGGIGLILIKGVQSLAGVDHSAASLTEPFKIINKYLGRPEDIFECQNELIEAGYEEFAKL